MKILIELWHVKIQKTCSMVDQRAHLFVWQLLLPTRVLEIRPLRKWVIIRFKKSYLNICFKEEAVILIWILFQVYDTLLLSPGLHTNVHKDRVSKRREKEKERKSSVRYKKRRHELKQIKSSQVRIHF